MCYQDRFVIQSKQMMRVKSKLFKSNNKDKSNKSITDSAYTA